ncbi:Uncharacterized protein Rs2_36933 [Raphanus sativus]|nr:Uncharacterized protein Rs2_36933 [Raphanus sativus]
MKKKKEINVNKSKYRDSNIPEQTARFKILEVLLLGKKDGEEAERSGVSSTEAVLFGALAPGVNAPTWNTMKLAFLMLGLCLTFMLSIAFTSSQSMLLVHVGFLIVIASSLFVSVVKPGPDRRSDRVQPRTGHLSGLV